jgi:hypothetical protein
VEHTHLVELRGQPVGDLAGAVGRPVVDHEHGVLQTRRRELGQRRAHDGLDVLGLVVGREDQPRSWQSGA